MGGKAALVPKLLALLPEHTTYVEPFAGAANLLLTKPASKVEVLNDIDQELVNLLRTIKTHPKQLIQTASRIPYSRVWFERLQQEVKAGPLKGSQVQRAAKFWFLIRASFFGHPNKGWRFSLRTTEAMRLENGLEQIQKVANRLRKVYIDSLDFRKCIRNWDGSDTFFAVDPPYYKATAYRKGVKPFTPQDHCDLAITLRMAEGKWLLTLNDRPEVRKLYRGFLVTPVDTQMATWKGPAGSKRPRLRQLIIRNYKLVEASSSHKASGQSVVI
jgi:DNA adenine methylase